MESDSLYLCNCISRWMV